MNEEIIRKCPICDHTTHRISKHKWSCEKYYAGCGRVFYYDVEGDSYVDISQSPFILTKKEKDDPDSNKR